MCLLCCWVIEGEVLLGEVKAADEREVPQGEAEGGEQQQLGAEPEVPLGEQKSQKQQNPTAESDHGLSFIFGGERSGHNC